LERFLKYKDELNETPLAQIKENEMKKKISDYWIIHNHDLEVFEKEVGEYIKKGLQPWGSLLIHNEFMKGENKVYYYQAMVKCEE